MRGPRKFGARSAAAMLGLLSRGRLQFAMPPNHHRNSRRPRQGWRLPRRVVLLALLAALLVQGVVVSDNVFASRSATGSPVSEAAATKQCNVKKQLANGRVVTVYKTKIVKVKVKVK